MYHIELEAHTTDSGRKYVVGNNLYDSVTTVTGFMAKESIKKWRDKVGHEVADKISNESSTRGTQLHALCEDYYMSNLDKDAEFREDTLRMFESLKPHLSNINKPYAVETCLYSDWLCIAGRSDLIGEYNGIPSVVDFKTSRKPKKREWIDGYFAQLTMYSLMFRERFGVSLEQLVIMMVSVNGQVQLFEEPITQKHYDNMFNFIDLYRNSTKC